MIWFVSEEAEKERESQNAFISTGHGAQGTTTSSTTKGYTTVEVAQRRSTNPQPNSTLAADGRPSSKVCRGPSPVRLILMAGGLRSPAPPVVATWAMSSNGRGTRCLRTRGIVLTASPSSLCRSKRLHRLHNCVVWCCPHWSWHEDIHIGFIFVFLSWEEDYDILYADLEVGWSITGSQQKKINIYQY